MKFQQRLNRFLIGLVIGLVLVAFLFNDRDWAGWTPNNQVVTKAMENYQEPSSEVLCQMECLGIDVSKLKTLVEDGDVEFDKSQVDGNPKVYYIEHEDETGQEYFTRWEFEEMSLTRMDATLIEIGPQKDCDCE
jgi:hypothetical protein